MKPVIRNGLALLGWLLVSCAGTNRPTPTPVQVAATQPAATITPTAVIAPTNTVSLPSDPVTLAWTTAAGGAINHPPLIMDDLVIAVPEQEAVIALNLADGSVRWRFDPPYRLWDRAYAGDSRSFFIGGEEGRLIALDVQSGAVNWQIELGINAQTPLLATAGALYVPTTFVGPGLTADPEGKAQLFAIDLADGRTLWAFTSDNYILQTPYRLADTIYVGGSYEAEVDVDEGGPMRLYALSAADGSEKWAFESLDGYPKQVFANETAVAYIAYQDFVSGVDVAAGTLRWRRDTGNWVPTLTGVGDLIYFGSANTVVHALNVADGAVVWQFNIPEGTFNYVLGAPVRMDDTLYFLTQQGDLMALNAEDGRLLWHYATAVAARTGLAAANNYLVIGDAEGLIRTYVVQ